MDIDDLEPRKKRTHELGQDISKLSVAELQELIAALKDEIRRLEQARDAKQSSLSAAEAAFKR